MAFHNDPCKEGALARNLQYGTEYLFLKTRCILLLLRIYRDIKLSKILSELIRILISAQGLIS